MAREKLQMKIYGLTKEPDFYRARVAAEGLSLINYEIFERPVSKTMIENEWSHFIHDIKQVSTCI